MKTYKTILPEQWEGNPFTTINDDWLLVTATDGERTNTMTASWGSLGILWGRKVASIYIRPSRFTYSLLEKADHFSLTVLPNRFRRELNYLGTASGRDEDKIKKAGLTLRFRDGVPYFEEGRLVFFCDKLYAQPFEGRFFNPPSLAREIYPDDSFHTLFVGNITAVWEEED